MTQGDPPVAVVLAPAAPRRRRPWLVLLASWLALGIGLGVYSLATPPLAGADEWAHVVKAAGVWHGQLLGEPDPRPQFADSALRVFHVPSDYQQLQRLPLCYQGRDVSAACVRPLQPASGQADVASYVGRYPVLYYALVGGVTRVVDGDHALAALRLASAFWSSLFLAVALTAAVVAGRRLLAGAVSLVLTPTAVFFAAVVNPSGLEVSLATCAWVTGLVVVEHPRAPGLGWVRVAFPASLALLAQVRALSPFWAVLIVVGLWVAAPPGAVRTLLRTRWLWVSGAVVAASGLLATAWVVGADALHLVPDATHAHESLGASVEGLVRYTGTLLPQMVSALGAFDVPVSVLALLCWGAVLGTLVSLGLVAGDARARWALLGVLAGIVLVPIALGLTSVHTAGYAWQGRYTLPLLAGVPPLAAVALERAPELHRPARSLLALLVLPAAAADLTTYVLALHRWALGLGRSGPFLTGPWQPHGSLRAVLVLGCLGLVLARVAVLALSRTARPLEGAAREPSPAPVTAGAAVA